MYKSDAAHAKKMEVCSWSGNSHQPLAERLPPLTHYKNPSLIRFAVAFGSSWRSGPLATLEVEAAAASLILGRLPAIILGSSQTASNGRIQ